MTSILRRSWGASASCVKENERAVALYKGEVSSASWCPASIWLANRGDRLEIAAP